MGKVLIRRLDGVEIEVPEDALGAYTKRGWILAEGGSAKDVLEAVGDDPSKAAAALAAEQHADKPRKTLIAQLEKLAAPSGTDHNKE